MISVELNTAVKAKFQTLGSPYNAIKFIPLSAYENTTAPLIIYTEFPGTFNDEQFFMSVSNVVYSIYDNNISRMKDIAYQLNKFLNVGDRLDEVKSYLTVPYQGVSGETAYRYRITGCRQVSGSAVAPPEREGFSVQTLNFRITYVGNTGGIS